MIEVLTANQNMVRPNKYFVGYYLTPDGNIIAYDCREPQKLISSIIDKHPDYEFLKLESIGNEQQAREICEMFRIVRTARLTLLKDAERYKVVVEYFDNRDLKIA